ncbi:ABC transporter substrate-binding protein [Candidatus Omnitrophota bacterium]
MLNKFLILSAILAVSMGFYAFAEEDTDKKVLYINSYHTGYEWSDGITKGIHSILDGKKINLKTVDMDTKRNTSEEFKKEAGLKAKEAIEDFKPEVIITADDNAFKYVIMPYFKDAEIPVVFCGLNWDASGYGAPYTNTTGMIEVALIEPLIDTLKKHASGNRIGYIAGDVLSAKKEVENYAKIYNIQFTERYVSSFDEWKQAFLEIQNQVDILIVYNNAGVEHWDKDEAEEFVEKNTKIPTGSTLEHIAPYVLVTFGRIAEEQGEWAANATLQILDGAKPSDIPLAKNKRGKLYVNLQIAEKLGVVFAPEILKYAEIVEEAKKKVLFVDSYHKGYEWNDGIEKGIVNTLKDAPVELKIYRMDTKRNSDERFKKQAALEAKALIEEFKPDVVIASDDNASKYLIEPYYKDKDLPFVFCGLNWDASIYGFPCKNVTGMVEVDLIDQSMGILQEYTRGKRVAYFARRDLSEQKNGQWLKKLFFPNLVERYVSSYEEWKQAFLETQEKVDIMIIGNYVGIADWQEEEAIKFMQENTKIPTTATGVTVVNMSLMTLLKVPEEQGEWSAETALKILDGVAPSDIPVVKNKRGKLYLNMKIAEKLHIIFKPALMRNAELITE